jgi:hypothetical protein
VIQRQRVQMFWIAYMTVGAEMMAQRIAEARGRAGLTQAQPAAVVALDRSALTTTEAGGRRATTHADWSGSPGPRRLIWRGSGRCGTAAAVHHRCPAVTVAAWPTRVVTTLDTTEGAPLTFVGVTGAP